MNEHFIKTILMNNLRMRHLRTMYGYEDITRETGWSWGSVRP